MIISLLKQLGFSQKEAEVYLAILENGKITPAQLSDITKIKRTTVYAVAKELLRRGVIAEDQSGSITYLVALPPSDLANAVNREEAELIQKKVTVKKAVKALKTTVKNTKYSIPKMVFISEGELEQYLYKQTPIWAESIKQRDNTWWGFQDPSFVQSYQAWIDWFWHNPKTKNIVGQMFTNQSDVEEEMKKKNFPNRQIKFWKGGNDFTSTIWIIGDYIVMVNTGQRPHYLVEIHDATMAHNLRELFKNIWQMS